MVFVSMKNVLMLLVLAIAFFSCSKQDEGPKKRTYRMGFQNSAPRFDDFNLTLQSLNTWTQRADAAIISTEVPWDSLLAGEKPENYVFNNYKGLVDFYRSKNFKLWVYVDPQNGLDRTSDATALTDKGKSIADANMQYLYRRFVMVMDSILHPEHIGFALETNLIRLASPPSIYNGVKKAVNDVAQELRLRNKNVKFSVSIQADMAWGKLAGGSYQGIEQDFIDFPFIDELGISSYPYFGFTNPDDLPTNYYSRLVEGKNISVFISEGGWASGSWNSPSTSFASSPQMQQRYIIKQAELLDQIHASALFQLTFTDIDTAHLPSPYPPNLVYFTTLGLVDEVLNPKPALASWDEIFKRPYDP